MSRSVRQDNSQAQARERVTMEYRTTALVQPEHVREYVGYAGHRAHQVLFMCWEPMERAHRATTMLSVNDCNTMSALGHDVQISGDATTRWIGQ